MILFVPDVQLGISRGKRTARWTVRRKERKTERKGRKRQREVFSRVEKTNGRERRERNEVEYPTNSSDPIAP